MPSQTPSIDRTDRPNATTASRERGRAPPDGEQTTPPTPVAYDECGPQTRLEAEIRAVAATAAMRLVEQERSSFAEDRAALEAERERLEAELAEQKRTLEQKDRQLQTVIDRYEALLEEKELAYREHLDTQRSERSSATNAKLTRDRVVSTPIGSILARLRTLVSAARRS